MATAMSHINKGRAMMDFQIGSLFIRVSTDHPGHINMTAIAPIGEGKMINVKVNLSNEQGTQALTGMFRTYDKGDRREEKSALEG